jgi:hypothetical protein
MEHYFKDCVNLEGKIKIDANFLPDLDLSRMKRIPDV